MGWERNGYNSEGYTPTWVYAAMLGLGIGLIILGIWGAS